MKIFRNTVVAALAAAFMLVAAGLPAAAAETAGMVCRQTADSPRSTVQKFAAAMGNLQFDEAKKYCSKDTQKIVDSTAAFLKAMPADTPKEVLDDMKKTLKESFTFTIKSEKIDGDKAVVKFSSRNNGKTEDSEFTLKKIGGKWVICE